MKSNKVKQVFSFAAIMHVFCQRHMVGTTIEEEDACVSFLAGKKSPRRQAALKELVKQWPEMKFSELVKKNLLEELRQLAAKGEDCDDEMRCALINGWQISMAARLRRDPRAFYELEGS